MIVMFLMSSDVCQKNRWMQAGEDRTLERPMSSSGHLLTEVIMICLDHHHFSYVVPACLRGSVSNQDQKLATKRIKLPTWDTAVLVHNRS